jgi:hypothetical protein
MKDSFSGICAVSSPGGGVQQCKLLMKHWSIVWEVSRNKDYLGIGHIRVVHEVRNHLLVVVLLFICLFPT